MNIYSIVRYASSKSRLVGKRIWYNYYLKNWVECKRNKELLKNDIDDKNPLISVRIPTYNRAKILTERAMAWIFKNEYFACLLLTYEAF